MTANQAHPSNAGQSAQSTSNDDRPVLVYGGAGARGSAVAHGLLDTGRKVRVLDHLPHPGGAPVLNAVAEHGAEVVPGDLNDPASLAEASRGIGSVFLHPPLVGHPDQILTQMNAALRAASKAGVERVILATNSALPAEPCGVPAVEVNRGIEALLAEEEIHGIVLRPTLYLGNLLAPWSRPSILENGELAYPLPETAKVSWLAPEDAARAAILALSVDLTDGLVIPLAGPRAVLGDELAAQIAASVGREVHYLEVTPQDFGATLAPFLGEEAAARIADLYTYLSGPGTHVLNASAQPAQHHLNLNTRTVQQWATAQTWTKQ